MAKKKPAAETKMEKMKRLSEEAISARVKETKEKLLKEFADPNNKGYVSRVCRKVGVRTQTYYNYAATDKEFAEKVNEIVIDWNDGIVDFGIETLIAIAANQGKGAVEAVKELFKVAGKHRGLGLPQVNTRAAEESDGATASATINVNFKSTPVKFDEGEEWSRHEFDLTLIAKAGGIKDVEDKDE